MSTFYRLLGFLRPYKAALAASWGLASVAMVMTVLLPYLSGKAVEEINRGTSASHRSDAAARAHDRHQLVLLAGTIVLAVLARWALTYWRSAGRTAGRPCRPAAAGTGCPAPLAIHPTRPAHAHRKSEAMAPATSTLARGSPGRLRRNGVSMKR